MLPLRTPWLFIVMTWLLAPAGCSSSADSGGSTPDAGPGALDANHAHMADDGSSHASDARAQDAAATHPACSAIADLSVAASSSSAITLSWTGAPGISIQIARESYCGTDPYVSLVTLPAGAKTYTDSAVQPNWVYWYKITATDGAGAPASAAIATQASSAPQVGCAAGATERVSGVSSACSAAGDGGTPQGDAGPGGDQDAADGATREDGAAVDASMIVPAFYVATTGSDSNAGTLAAPFATFAAAQAAMRASSSIKTTYIRRGSYALPTLSCGGSTCGLNLTSADDGETWSYYPPDGVDSADLNAGSTGSGNGLVTAVSVSANNITINGLSIHDFQYSGIGSGGGVNNLLIENCLLFNGYLASGSSNPGGISCYGCGNMTISHNVIHDMAQFGVSISNVNGSISNLLVTGNVVYNTCTKIADCGALYVQDITTTATNLRFTNNYIHDREHVRGPGLELRLCAVRRRLHVERDRVGQRGDRQERLQYDDGSWRKQHSSDR